MIDGVFAAVLVLAGLDTDEWRNTNMADRRTTEKKYCLMTKAVTNAGVPDFSQRWQI